MASEKGILLFLTQPKADSQHDQGGPERLYL